MREREKGKKKKEGRKRYLEPDLNAALWESELGCKASSGRLIWDHPGLKGCLEDGGLFGCRPLFCRLVSSLLGFLLSRPSVNLFATTSSFFPFSLWFLSFFFLFFFFVIFGFFVCVVFCCYSVLSLLYRRVAARKFSFLGHHRRNLLNLREILCGRR